MRDRQVGCLVVTDSTGRIEGILTDRDLVARLMADGGEPSGIRVEEIMTREVVTCPPEMTAAQAGELMDRHRVRHVPVVRYGRAVGVVSARDVMASQRSRDQAMKWAAEEVARLVTSLKTLDYHDVVQKVACDVPRIFQAGRSVLMMQGECSPERGAQEEGGLVLRQECLCPPERLTAAAGDGVPAPGQPVLCRDVPDCCAACGVRGPRVTIPLYDPAPTSGGPVACLNGVLCMCGLSGEAAEVVEYKGGLVEEIVNANLANALHYGRMRQQSRTDALTGAASRRAFEEVLRGEFARGARHGRPFSVGRRDLDYFKSINDRFGHAVGDEALRSVAACLMEEKRQADLAARYGGDEFAVLLPETSGPDALAVLERVRERIGRITVGGSARLSISGGVASVITGSLGSPKELLGRADQALYEAKRAGRDRVRLWPNVAPAADGRPAEQAAPAAESW
jgi:diguanylate cyclase (GGDEF)-like protein